MTNLTYKSRLSFASKADKDAVLSTLRAERDIFNFMSPWQFKQDKTSIVCLHGATYKKVRKAFPNVPAQIVIRAQNSLLGAYRSIRSNKHKIKSPVVKKRLSLQLDRRLYCWKNGQLRVSTTKGRVSLGFHLYDKLEHMIASYEMSDPLIFEDDGEFWLSLSFKVPEKERSDKPKCVGIDLGIRRLAVTSEGKAFKDKQMNAAKRRIRYNKRKLRSAADKGSKTAKRHLKKIRHKERNQNNEIIHKLANQILQSTKANVIVLEDLKNIKKSLKKKKPYKNQNQISQIPFAGLKRVLTYKAHLQGREVKTVCPSYTSQIDHVSNKKDGIRRGCRYYSKSGSVYDADHNAAINIAKRAKLPISCVYALDGQVVVNPPNVCQSGYVNR